MKFICLIVTYLIDALRCMVGCSVFWGIKPEKKYLLLLGMIPGLIALWRNPDTEYYMLVLFMYIGIVACFAVSDKGSFWKRVGKPGLVIFFNVAMDTAMDLILDCYGIVEGEEYFQKSNFYFASMILSYVVLLCAFLLKKHFAKVDSRKIQDIISKCIYYAMVVMSVNILLGVGGIGIAQSMTTDYKARKLLAILGVNTIVSLFLVIGSAIYIRRLNWRLKGDVKQREELLKMQQQYYEKLLKREEETRRYRHDMQTHLMCIQGFAKEKNYDSVNTYIDDILNLTNEITIKTYKTGNKTADMLTAYNLEKLDESVRVKVIGEWKKDIPIFDSDLCIIYGNLLANAVEEVKSNNRKDNFIEIEFRQKNDLWHIIIKNSCEAISEDYFATKKKDKLNHGIGLQNVDRTVRDIGGRIQFNIEDGVFEVSFSYRKMTINHLN